MGGEHKRKTDRRLISPQTIHLMRQMRIDGATSSHIATRFGVSRNAVHTHTHDCECWKTCSACGEPFECSENARRKYCSRECIRIGSGVAAGMRIGKRVTVAS